MIQDVIIVGAGASGLFCAIEAGRAGRQVLVLERDRKPGRKIVISGGGRCNFTNLRLDPRQNYLSRNPHFCLSALSRYRPEDFVARVESHGIAWHEKKLGQLFCDGTSQQIVDMLLTEAAEAGVVIACQSEVTRIARRDDLFEVWCGQQLHLAESLVIASGGLSIPNLTTDLAFRTAADFGLKLVPTRAALVPFTYSPPDKERFGPLSGISLDVSVAFGKTAFRENLLFTHRGLSGPAILQISSYWQEGEPVVINLLPDEDADAFLSHARATQPKLMVPAYLAQPFPRRFVEAVTGDWYPAKPVGQLTADEMAQVAERLRAWRFMPGGTEGYRTAEVTIGGVDTDELSSKTFECRRVPGLYVIGEAVDVTGWLGGYNFQWAWASAWCCAQAL